MGSRFSTRGLQGLKELVEEKAAVTADVENVGDFRDINFAQATLEQTINELKAG